MSLSSPSSPSQEAPSRFVVGIDLGTTNSAVAYVDTAERPWRTRTFAAPQLVAPGQVEPRETLPSFHYQAAPGELAKDALRLPWSSDAPSHAVGFFARDHGVMTPGRLIASAKSWLCHSGVDRTADLLPWQGADDVERLSPVEVSGRILGHIREAWDAAFPQHPLAEQDLVLTLPASFDEVARELTVKAAARAGLARVVLIEEPQAAFYAWIYAHADRWETLVSPGQKILVCDCGGGTSDFTLIRVRRAKGGEVQFHRVAVGNHLILGGDNLDLTLARHIEQRLTAGGRMRTGTSPNAQSSGKTELGSEPVPILSPDGGKLTPRQWAVLVRTCRQVKETLLTDDAPERLTVNLPGAGAKLIGGGLQIEVGRDEVRELLLDGFFPRVALDEKPSRRASGFQEFGLPFAPDPAITRYLAAFLEAHRHVAMDEIETTPDHDPARPDIVLFNGGLFESPDIRDRLLDVLRSWFTANDPGWTPLVLANDRLDLAVARGAAYYGMVRRGEGVRIAAGLARTYYVGVQGETPSVVCLVPAEAEPGHDVELTGRRFDLLVGDPVEFPLFISSTRLTDRPGELIAIDREQMTPLPPIRTVLHKRRKTDPDVVSVELHARLTEIGTLDLWCAQVDSSRSWRLQFDVRSAVQTDIAAHESDAESEGVLDEAIWEQCRGAIESTFGPEGKDKPSELVKRLSRATGISRREWPTSLLRRIWETLVELESGRRRSESHEARWLNLLGFSLRPGYGLAADDWRVAQTWRLLQGNLLHSTVMCRAEWWVLWRRIAGGLAAGQQQSLADGVLGPIRAMHRQLTTGKGRGGEFSAGSHETAEVWRLLGSFERLPTPVKIELGDILLDILPKPKMETVRPAIAWAIGRIGARQPLDGPLNGVVPVDVVGRWLERLMASRFDEPMLQLAVMQMARRTDDRYRDLPDRLREEVVEWLTGVDAPAHYRQLVETAGELDAEEQGLVFGEALPQGLRLR